MAAGTRTTRSRPGPGLRQASLRISRAGRTPIQRRGQSGRRRRTAWRRTPTRARARSPVPAGVGRMPCTGHFKREPSCSTRFLTGVLADANGKPSTPSTSPATRGTRWPRLVAAAGWWSTSCGHIRDAAQRELPARVASSRARPGARTAFGCLIERGQAPRVLSAPTRPLARAVEPRDERMHAAAAEVSAGGWLRPGPRPSSRERCSPRPNRAGRPGPVPSPPEAARSSLTAMRPAYAPASEQPLFGLASRARWPPRPVPPVERAGEPSAHGRG